MLAQIAEMPLSNPVGIAMGQTNLSAFGESQALDLFLAQIDPDFPDKVVDDFHEYLNFEITGESTETIEVKHGCLSTAALSPIVATPAKIAFRAFSRRGQLIEGFFHGMPAAIAWHEYWHNRARLMVSDPGVSVINCVPQRHVELSRSLSPADSKEKWPLRYSTKQIQAILSGEHPLY
jgi:peptide deformylase